jgi:hypothetical protein
MAAENGAASTHYGDSREAKKFDGLLTNRSSSDYWEIEIEKLRPGGKPHRAFSSSTKITLLGGGPNVQTLLMAKVGSDGSRLDPARQQGEAHQFIVVYNRFSAPQRGPANENGLAGMADPALQQESHC